MRDTIYSVEVDGQVIEASSEHPFYVQGEWKETKNLDGGDKLTLFNQDCESSIASITIEARRDTVYNLSVADFETYFVSELGILVHNCKVLNSDRDLTGGKKHALKMQAGDAQKMADKGVPIGVFRKKSDIEFAHTKAAELKPGEMKDFKLPAGSNSEVFVPRGDKLNPQKATHVRVRNNGDGTAHVFPINGTAGPIHQ